MTTPDLWSATDDARWHAALASYRDVVTGQGVGRLVELDDWYLRELPARMAARTPPHVTLEELVRATEWKMARGEWRGRNLALVGGNAPQTVVETSAAALAQIPRPTQPIATLVTLEGVGPATASAILAAHAPHSYPFFDELVAAQIPTLGKVAWALPYYARYADALRQRASRLGGDWTPAAVAQALWANAGGKKGYRPTGRR